jgi:PAP2 superfamily
MNGCLNGSFGAYPDEDWTEEFRPAAGSTAPLKVTYRGNVLSLSKPSEDIPNECLALHDSIEFRGAVEEQIHVEAKNLDMAATTVLAAAGLRTNTLPFNHRLVELRSWVIDEITPAVKDFKWMFMRARPWTCCGEKFESMLRPHKYYPGQPAFPSGHATVAWVFAYLLASPAPNSHLAAEVRDAARGVAYRREVAGVHYASDSEGGRQLAKQMTRLLLRDMPSEVKELLAMLTPQSVAPTS